MRIKIEEGRRVLHASEGKILQSVTDGLIIGPRIILCADDSEKHYHEIEAPADELSN